MIAALASHFPIRALDNKALAAIYPDWSAEKILEKTGIRFRHIAGTDESATDLAFRAAERLLRNSNRTTIDALLFCTQSPDYPLPASACLLHQRLGLSSHAAAFDFNIGCSGYIYGLALASNFILGGQGKTVLLLTGDTYSKYIEADDRNTRTLFGDAGSATLLSHTSTNRLHSFVFGTDGSGAEKIIVRDGHLTMDGPDVFNFTLERVPPMVDEICGKAGVKLPEVDLFIFHQANAFMLEHLRRKLDISPEKFVLHLENCGNTVSSSIPLALESRLPSLRPGMRILLAGFGVGYSWAGCLLEWNENNS